MSKDSMSGQTAWASLSLSRSTAWHRIRVVSGFIVVIVVFVSTLLIFKYRHLEHLEQNWKCATATIEDVRFREIEQVSSARGGVVLYEVSIFAKYASGGTDHRQWIVVEQPPVTLAEVELETFRWKGQQCVVRWKLSEPEQMIAEVS
jgi:hypothetical protein